MNLKCMVIQWNHFLNSQVDLPLLEIESFTMFQILKNQTLSKLSFISIIKKGLEYYYNVVGLHYQDEHNY